MLNFRALQTKLSIVKKIRVALGTRREPSQPFTDEEPKAAVTCNIFSLLIPKQRSYFCATDAAAGFFPITLCRGVIRIHVSRVAPDL